jgi:hypothetical protein
LLIAPRRSGNDFDQNVEIARGNFVGVHKFQATNAENLVTMKGQIDRIGVDAERRLPFACLVLWRSAAINDFPTPPLPCSTM